MPRTNEDFSTSESAVEKHPGGRPPFEPTNGQRETVKLFSAYGIPQDDIAEHIGIDPKTLRAHFRAELSSGIVEANAKIAQRLFTKAMAGDTTAMIWWTKARAGWRETVRQEVTGNDGGPVQISGPVIMLPPESDD